MAVAGSSAADLAAELACCRLCALRLHAERNRQSYTGQAANGPPDAAAAACSICMGMLDGAVLDVLCASAAAEMAVFDARQFALNVQLPPSCLVRERAAWLHATSAKDAVPRSAPPAATGAIARDLDAIVDLKEVLRWAFADRLSQLTGMTPAAEAALQVNILAKRATTEEESRELDVLQSLLPGPPKPKRKRFSHRGAPEAPVAVTGDFGQVATDIHSIRSVVKALGDPHARVLILNSFLCPPQRVAAAAQLSVGIEHSPVFLAGEYVKLSRQLPQTAWIIDGARKCPSSVQELIEADVVTAFGAELARFHSAGREDVDVRMLGHGRPFMLELRGAHRSTLPDQRMAELQALICESGTVHVRNLRVCDAAYVQSLVKEGEEGHCKDYRAVVRLGRDVAQAELDGLASKCPLELAQLTPLRVLHRRTHATRPRSIYALRATRIAPRFALLDLTTQAGTYVKEFVHGDFGRTVPSLGDMLNCEADILQLDVLGVRPKQDCMKPPPARPPIPE
jgi:tRNA pseudouridine synthase 10